MKVIYRPNTGDGSAFALLIPDDTNKKLVLEIAIHGRGERSAGTQENLENLVLGQKQPDGSRKWPFVFDDMKKAVDQYGILMAIPAYSNFMEPALINKVYDYCKAHYNMYDKFILTGFSLGGGAVVKYITSSLANAGRVAFAVPCAATNDVISSGATYPGNVGMSVHAFHNDRDDIVSVSSTKAVIATLSTAKPLMTIFRQDGHGSNEKAWGLLPPKAPNGQGFIDAGENMYEVGVDCVINSSRQMRSGDAAIPKAAPDTTSVPQPTVTPVTSFTIDDKGIHLRGDKSIGYKSGMDGKWEFVSGPAGTNVYNVFPKGSSYINADGVLPVPGTYVFRFILKGANPVEVTVNNGVPQKTPVSFEGSGTLKYSDGSSETLTITFADGKLVVKNSAGQIINL